MIIFSSFFDHAFNTLMIIVSHWLWSCFLRRKYILVVLQ